MKILFFSPYFYPYTSGITTYPFLVFSHLAKQNEVTVLTFPHIKELPKEEHIDNMTIVRLPYSFKISKGFISPQSLYFFFKYLQKSDIVFLNIPNFEGIFLAILAKILKKRIISIYHCEVKLNSGFFNSIIEYLLSIAVLMQLLLSDTIIGYTKDYVMDKANGRRFKNKFVFTLPPVPSLPYTKTNHDSKKFTLGFAGRIAQEKGLEFLIDAASTLQKEGVNLELIFAGPLGKEVAGEEQYYKKIHSLLDHKKLKFTFLGTLKNKDFGNFYKSVDILVLPSVNKTEAFGMVQVEAMLAGTPVIASDLPGVRVPITLTKMGLIVEPKDVGGLADAIKEIKTNYSKYTNEELVKKAHEVFDIDKTFKLYDKLIRL